MRVTKAMLESANEYLRKENANLIRQVDALKSENTILRKVSDRPDTALISAQRIAESSSRLNDATIEAMNMVKYIKRNS